MPNGTKGNFIKALENPGRLECDVRSIKPEQCMMFYTKETRQDKDLTLRVHSCYLSISLLLLGGKVSHLCPYPTSEIQPAGQIFHVSVSEDESSSSPQLLVN